MNNEELYSLYKQTGSISELQRYLLEHGLFEAGMSATNLKRRLKSVDDNYSLSSNKAVAKPKEAKPVASGVVHSPDKTRQKLTGKRYVFTTAQNNTYVHQRFLQSLLMFTEVNDAELIVSTCSYNKSGFQNSTKESEGLWYDPAITEYIRNESLEITPGIIFCGELDILPTAQDPLAGFENYTKDASGIIPHVKMAMRSHPRMKGEPPRFTYTTGSITLRNYIQKRAGQKAEFHHVFGALYVEIDESGNFFVRQLVSTEDGVFNDLDWSYSPEGVNPANVTAITWGDIHTEKLDLNVFLGMMEMTTKLRPAFHFMHDITDFMIRNHHNINDPIHYANMHKKGTNDVRKSLKSCAAVIGALVAGTNSQVIVVSSNHDHALTTWLKSADIKKDPENAEFYHEALYRIHKAIREDTPFDVFAWSIYGDTIPDGVTFLEEDDSFVIHDIENGMHGHRGPNGSRGAPKQFRSIGKKVNIGHVHTAGIYDGVYVAGVSAVLDMGYNKGPSSWSHSHIVTYANGKRAIITQRGSKWKA